MGSSTQGLYVADFAKLGKLLIYLFFNTCACLLISILTQAICEEKIERNFLRKMIVSLNMKSTTFNWNSSPILL
ncbi:hypothetical protein Y032_0245g3543 [Ancylostoma ceylanicum]|uniref:Uncharacterized protein n=1 Tax=Ancylostoma ceylanicum TaxID=53326 RepID=A0A016SD08_9BILA|nr:hypothetical protein Y032_0245g3543 [Ancylostoma ceylanicum]